MIHVLGIAPNRLQERRLEPVQVREHFVADYTEGLELPTVREDFFEGQGQQSGGAIGSDLRYQLYDGVRAALEGILREEPVVLVFDDLHHAPQPKVALVSYLVRTLIVRDSLPLLVMASIGISWQPSGL